ncbi:hypothetical protein NCS57_01086200 [Fusarium keratoplasticum]|uniref:Uncharacterized protein n=1 Tax=Fusarium keratoplasticum TaxID=1328300 RepID=A0ACC0QPM0_9HYPO|nr:hypothetical protein NCS57_01086200 [Fusarium keratoplasticum]KAI8661068.1 hypothetical protein NCS57_01086200 [Fusarium keratoplasticum]
MAVPRHDTRHAVSKPKITIIQNQPLSELLPYGSLILGISLIFVILLSNILERWVLRKAYTEVYNGLERGKDERRRRSFVYFHIGIMIMLSLLAAGAYPVLYFLTGASDFSTLLIGNITLGDVLFILSEIYSSYYFFELCFRTKFSSPISIAHHFGLLAVIQTALALFADIGSHPEATLEFYMCMVWGAFDVVTEIPIYGSMIVWRLRRDNSQLLVHIAYGCSCWATTAAAVEVAITIYLLHLSWDRWGAIWRIVTPIIFALWIVTQLYGAFRFFKMAQTQRSK